MTTVSSDECRKQDDLHVDEGDEIETLSSSNDASDFSNPCPFNAEISDKLSAAFAKATGIDIEFAIDLLNEHGWNIDQALEATYQAKEQAQSMMVTKESWKNTSEDYLKILSWNINCPDSDEEELNDLTEQRVETVVEILLRAKPQVILLQNVGTFALTLIITSLSSFYDDESVQIDPPNNCNYVSIFTRKADLTKSNVSIIEHSNHWKMLHVQVADKNGIDLDLFNALIDDNASSEEISSFCFQRIEQTTSDHPVLCGISSRISDHLWESRPSTLEDAWEVTGKQPEAMFSFDPALNSSIESNEHAARYDRLLFRSATSMKSVCKPMHMEFEGIQHVKTSPGLFPSTHWALQVYFHLQN